ncbi:preprotein translocase subunit SecG [Acuticoccus sp. MNP-M23]|uniref:preprotein translocase subunit SecG n=1 Tax=Acuticoccus sp. MNP-M23 TaxID=3072793 RepID=UPI002814C8C4|nr:preprotein translocase subunit SecG [Acuticoccus sp. MNP-M23]WMS42270.1 preprotein translocase subunit SecG [Acuticoccus sp. MNP-M23]
MQTVIIVIHLMIVIALIAVILLQRSEGGGLGIGGGGGGGGGAGGGMFSARGSANLLTRTTTFLAIAFFVTSLGLGILARQQAGAPSILDGLTGTESGTPLGDGETRGTGTGILDALQPEADGTPAPPSGDAAAPEAPSTPAAPTSPQVPTGQ